MMFVKMTFMLLALAAACCQSKPSHSYGFPAVFDHLDLVPPVLPPAHFNPAEPAPFAHHHDIGCLEQGHFHTHPGPLLPFPGHLPFAATPLLTPTAHLIPAHAPLLPAPVSFLPPAPAVAPLLPAPAPLLPAPLPLLPAASAPVLPAPVVHSETHIIQAPAPIVPPVLDTLPVIEHAPSFRAVFGPKTTTHHVSLGYAFPQLRLPKLHGHVHSLPHAHLHAHPFAFAHQHHHHHHKHF